MITITMRSGKLPFTVPVRIQPLNVNACHEPWFRSRPAVAHTRQPKGG